MAWLIIVPSLFGQEAMISHISSQPIALPPSTGQSVARIRELPSAEIATGYQGHYACRFFSGIDRRLAIAVSDTKPKTVTALIQAGGNINARSSGFKNRRRTMLQMAVCYDWGLESVQLLLRSDADTSARDEYDDTALSLACQNDLRAQLPIIASLIHAGADVNVHGAKGMTPLMHAALHGNTAMAVKVLLAASADVSARDNMDWTALMHATRRRRERIDVIRMLSEAGSDINARHRYGGTALLNAAYNGQTQTVRFLLHAGADVNASDEAKWTPLIGAAMNGHFQVARLLIQSGARGNMIDKLGRTALTLARANGHESIEKLLIQTGAGE